MSLPESGAASRYPDTAFLADFVVGPAQTRLLRSAYVTEYFSGGRQWMRDRLGAIMAADQMIWPTDVRAETPAARAALDISFEDGLGYEIASSVPSAAYQDVIGEGRADRAERLKAAWQTVRRQSPAYGDPDRETIQQIHERLPKPSHKRITGYDALARAMMYIDIRALGDSPADSPRPQSPPDGESIFREAVLASRSTGIRRLDGSLGTAYEHTFLDVHARSLAMLKQMWERHHPGETFYPAVYKTDRRAIELKDKVLRPLFYVGGSLVWWSAYGGFDLQDRIEDQKNM